MATLPSKTALSERKRRSRPSGVTQDNTCAPSLLITAVAPFGPFRRKAGIPWNSISSMEGFMGIRNDVKMGADMQQFDAMADQGNAAGPAIIAGIAVLEGKNPLQAEYSLIVTNQPQGTADHRFIKKLQPLLTTRLARGINTEFTGFQVIQPKPHEADKPEQKQQFDPIHYTSIRKAEILYR